MCGTPALGQKGEFTEDVVDTSVLMSDYPDTLHSKCQESSMSDRLSVHGRTVCITGSSSGMGRAIAEHLGALGATVYLMGRNAEPMEESKARIEAAGGKADLATFDVADTAALQAWIQRAADETGRLDVMINNAGFGDFGTSFRRRSRHLEGHARRQRPCPRRRQPGRRRRNAGH